MNICENIRKIRKQKGLTLKQLGSKIGVSEQAVGQYERGDRKLKAEMLPKIAAALDVDILELTTTSNIIKELDLNINKVFAKNTDGSIEFNLEPPIEQTFSDDNGVSFLRGYIRYVSEKNDILLYSNEIDELFNFIKPTIDLLINNKAIELYNTNRGIQLK